MPDRHSQEESHLCRSTRTYFSCAQTFPQAKVETLTKEFSTIVEEGGGSVPKVEHWGLRTLAYRMKKNRKAHYILLNIDAPTDAVQEMERNMRIHEDVLRHLTIKVEELEEGPSIIMQSKGSRDDRGRDDRRRDDRGGRTSSRNEEKREDSGKSAAGTSSGDTASSGDKE